jgi:hypothetical protein
MFFGIVTMFLGIVTISRGTFTRANATRRVQREIVTM